MRATLRRRDVLPLIRRALVEDRARADVTSRLLPASLRLRATVISKQSGTLAGGPAAQWTFQALDRRIRCRGRVRDGRPVRRGQTVMTVEGPARSILAAERTALNVLGHLSGIATVTRRYARAAAPVPLLDSRKTLPGLRDVEKYAVRVGGGHRHRRDLAAAILIKTNHLRALGHGAGGRGPGKAIQAVIKKARLRHPRKVIEVEVTNMQEFRAALGARPTVILLDNWSVPAIRHAVGLRNATTPHAPRPTPLLEASGGVTLANVRRIARTGVDRISVGRLTHSAPALDCSLRIA